MTTKHKPRLHLVKGSGDPGLYDAEIDWYYGAFDYECGLKSIGEMQREIADKVGGTRKNKTVDGIEDGDLLKVKVSKEVVCTDPDVFFNKYVRGVLTKGRRVWNRLQSLTTFERDTLRKYYEPRQYWDSEDLKPKEEDVRHAHGAYRAA